jgi:hypothetical protein
MPFSAWARIPNLSELRPAREPKYEFDWCGLLDYRGPDSDQNSAAQRNVGDVPMSESHCSIEAFKRKRCSQATALRSCFL